MLSLRKFVLTVGALALCSVPSLAFAQGGRGMGMGGGAFMLTQEAVQKELKFTDEQKSKAQDAINEIRQAHMDEMAALRDASPEERPAKMATLNKAMAEEAIKALGLKEDQVKRFHQVSLQAQGARAFSQKEVAEKLKLTDDQKKEIGELVTASGAQAREIFMNAGENREEAMKQIAALNKETNTKVFALLKDDQKATWKEMTGDAFEYTPVFRRPNN
jgi:hypothetical protein